MFDHECRSVSHPEVGTVEWPILFALGRFNAKHRFIDKLPPMAKFSGAITNFINRMHWNNYFHVMPEQGADGATSSGVGPMRVHVKGPTASCIEEDGV